jgi:lipid-A-disaccharide synthase-like uncharacterized protein
LRQLIVNSAKMARKKKKNIPFIFWQTVLFSALALGCGLLLSVWGGNRLVEQFPQFGSGLRTALLLFVLWLVVSSGVRSLHSLHKKFSFGHLVGGGSLIGLIGSLACFSMARVVAFFREGTTLAKVYDVQNLLFFAGVGLVVALLAAINLRTSNRVLGNVLEILVVAAAIFLMLYFA